MAMMLLIHCPDSHAGYIPGVEISSMNRPLSMLIVMMIVTMVVMILLIHKIHTIMLIYLEILNAQAVVDDDGDDDIPGDLLNEQAVVDHSLQLGTVEEPAVTNLLVRR